MGGRGCSEHFSGTDSLLPTLPSFTFFVLQTSTSSLPGTVQGAESTNPMQPRSEMVLALLKSQSSRQERHHARNVNCEKQGFPGGAGGKEPICQYRRRKGHGFDPWVRKIPWRRKWQPTPVFLPGKFHGQKSLGGYSPWGLQRVGHDSSDLEVTADDVGSWGAREGPKGSLVVLPGAGEELNCPCLLSHQQYCFIGGVSFFVHWAISQIQ